MGNRQERGGGGGGLQKETPLKDDQSSEQERGGLEDRWGGPLREAPHAKQAAAGLGQTLYIWLQAFLADLADENMRVKP